MKKAKELMNITLLSEKEFGKTMKMIEEEAVKRSEQGHKDAFVSVPEVCVQRVKDELTIFGYSIVMHDSHGTSIHFSWG